MAMKPCRECGKQVSSSAKTCPNCGVSQPVRRELSKKTLYFALGLLALIVTINSFGDSSGSSGSPVGTAQRPPNDRDPDFGRFVIDRSKARLKSTLKDPESVKWGTTEARVMEADGKTAVVACGTYNSKNSFGGYTGDKRFIGNGGDIVFTEESDTPSSFAESWRLMCSGRVLATSPATS